MMDYAMNKSYTDLLFAHFNRFYPHLPKKSEGYVQEDLLYYLQDGSTYYYYQHLLEKINFSSKKDYAQIFLKKKFEHNLFIYSNDPYLDYLIIKGVGNNIIPTYLVQDLIVHLHPYKYPNTRISFSKNYKILQLNKGDTVLLAVIIILFINFCELNLLHKSPLPKRFKTLANDFEKMLKWLNYQIQVWKRTKKVYIGPDSPLTLKRKSFSTFIYYFEECIYFLLLHELAHTRLGHEQMNEIEQVADEHAFEFIWQTLGKNKFCFSPFLNLIAVSFLSTDNADGGYPFLRRRFSNIVISQEEKNERSRNLSKEDHKYFENVLYHFTYQIFISLFDDDRMQKWFGISSESFLSTFDDFLPIDDKWYILPSDKISNFLVDYTNSDTDDISWEVFLQSLN